MILVIAAVLPWALIFTRSQVLVGAYFESGTLRQDFLIFLAIILQLPLTILVAWGFNPTWQRALGIFVANNLFFVVGSKDKKRIDVLVFADAQQCIVIAREDNVGKGACGASVLWMYLHLGCDEGLGL